MPHVKGKVDGTSWHRAGKQKGYSLTSAGIMSLPGVENRTMHISEIIWGHCVSKPSQFPGLKAFWLNNKNQHLPRLLMSQEKKISFYKTSPSTRHKFTEHMLKFYLGSVASDLGGYGGCRAGIIGMRNYNWGSLREEFRLWLMGLKRKVRPELRRNQVVFLLRKGLSQVRSCKRWTIGQPGSTLKQASIQKENVGYGDEEDKSNEGLGSRCFWGSLWAW